MGRGLESLQNKKDHTYSLCMFVVRSLVSKIVILAIYNVKQVQCICEFASVPCQVDVCLAGEPSLTCLGA